MSPSLNIGNKDIKKKILNAANSIRKKYLAMKLERNEEDEALNRFLHPITNPLNELVGEMANTKIRHKHKHKKLKLKASTPGILTKLEVARSTPKNVEFQPTEVVAEAAEQLKNESDDDDYDDVFNKPIHEMEAELELQKSILDRSQSYRNYLEQYPEIAQKYVDMHYNSSSEIDHSYIKHNKNNDIWTIGSEKVDFIPNGDIKVGNTVYKGTEGLYDLLFLKNPKSQTKNDEIQFQDILNKTNVHRRDFNPTAQIKGSTSSKYKNVIKPLVTAMSEAGKLKTTRKFSDSSNRPSPVTRSQIKSGSALMKYNRKPKQYVYYDNVNELIDRLVKLDASQEAGNGNHNNEIMSILEELVELEVIEPYK